MLREGLILASKTHQAEIEVCNRSRDGPFSFGRHANNGFVHPFSRPHFPSQSIDFAQVVFTIQLSRWSPYGRRQCARCVESDVPCSRHLGVPTRPILLQRLLPPYSGYLRWPERPLAVAEPVVRHRPVDHWRNENRPNHGARTSIRRSFSIEGEAFVRNAEPLRWVVPCKLFKSAMEYAVSIRPSRSRVASNATSALCRYWCAESRLPDKRSISPSRFHNRACVRRSR